jgi:hypothetical protein
MTKCELSCQTLTHKHSRKVGVVWEGLRVRETWSQVMKKEKNVVYVVWLKRNDNIGGGGEAGRSLGKKLHRC